MRALGKLDKDAPTAVCFSTQGRTQYGAAQSPPGQTLAPAAVSPAAARKASALSVFSHVKS